jgi:vacuolar-type H+-ATPase subunit I/STV1
MNTTRGTFFLVLMAVSMLCHAQDNPPVPLNLPVERARITQQRAEFEAAFVQKQQLCYLRFAVSDCLNKVKGERRVALDELRRQEIQLNSLERQAKALAELVRIQSNVSLERRQELELQRQQALLNAQKRQLRSEEKKAGAARPAVSASSVASTASPAMPLDDAVSQQQRFSERLLEAQQRKADNAKRLIEKGAGSAAPLPIPAGQ